MTRTIFTTLALSIFLVSAHADEETLFGMHTTTADLDRLEAWAEWTGEPVSAVGENLFATSWNDFTGRVPDSGVGYTLSEWRKSEIKPGSFLMEFAVPMFPDTEGNNESRWEQGARGDFNRYFESLAFTLVQHGWGDAHLRLGWEFNIGSEWNRWGIRDRPQDWPNFIAYWRQVHRSMMSVEGANFQWVWGVILDDDQGGFDPIASVWPGNEFVNVVAVDVYDSSGNYYWQRYEGNPPEQSWETLRAWTLELLLTGTKRDPYSGEELSETVMSLDSLYAQAQATGCEFAISEWGVVQGDAFPTDSGWGGNDNPDFIRGVAEWIGERDVKYALYFENFLASEAYGLVDHSILPDFWNQIGPNSNCVLPVRVGHPKSSAAYLKAFHGVENSPKVVVWLTQYDEREWALGDGWRTYRDAIHHDGAAGEATITLTEVVDSTIGLDLLLSSRPSATRLRFGSWEFAFNVLPDGRLGKTELFRVGEPRALSFAPSPKKPYVIGLRYLPLEIQIDPQWNGTRINLRIGDELLVTHLDEAMSGETPKTLSLIAPEGELVFARDLRQR